MTYSTSILVGSPPDPLYDSLLPSVQNLLIYDQELNDECPWITYEWATNEIKEHLLNWVRVGLVAEKVRYYKLWKEKFSSFADYCQKAIGKSKWQIGRIIKAARVTITLVHAGFDILPNCEAQASKLAKFLCDPRLLVEKWSEVIRSIPKHLITANAIGEVFGEQSKKQKLTISHQLKEKLQTRANELGISVEQLLEEFLEEEEPPESETLRVEGRSLLKSETYRVEAQDSSEVDRFSSHHQNKMERWQADLEQIVREHDLKNWLSLTWLKLLVPK